jgi:hypothetical protein
MPVHFSPHLPYSLNLALSEFFVFGDPKGKMQGLDFDSPETFRACIKTEFEAMFWSRFSMLDFACRQLHRT